jgi:urease accessory protein
MAALLRLLQLVSPALPIGAFAYSHGLEWARGAGWVRDERGVEDWIGGLLRQVWGRLDVPVLRRMVAAVRVGDETALMDWSELIQASRETAELRAEDRLMGRALARLLADLGVSGAARWMPDARCSLPLLWACAAVHWDMPLRAAAAGLLWSYVEHQVAAAIKLVPLGQTAGQLVLARLAEGIADAVATGLALSDADIGATAPALAIASCLHETQYSRLFRS